MRNQVIDPGGGVEVRLDALLGRHRGGGNGVVGIEVRQLRHAGGHHHLLHGAVGVVLHLVDGDIALVGAARGKAAVVVHHVPVALVFEDRLVAVVAAVDVLAVEGGVGQEHALAGVAGDGAGAAHRVFDVGIALDGIVEVVVALVLVHKGAFEGVGGVGSGGGALHRDHVRVERDSTEVAAVGSAAAPDQVGGFRRVVVHEDHRIEAPGHGAIRVSADQRLAQRILVGTLRLVGDQHAHTGCDVGEIHVDLALGGHRRGGVGTCRPLGVARGAEHVAVVGPVHQIFGGNHHRAFHVVAVAVVVVVGAHRVDAVVEEERVGVGQLPVGDDRIGRLDRGDGRKTEQAEGFGERGLHGVPRVSGREAIPFQTYTGS